MMDGKGEESSMNKEKQKGNEESSTEKEKQQGNEESSMKKEKREGNEESSVTKEKKQGNENSSTKKERHIVSWTEAEDDILREQIRIHGTENWAIIASNFNGKTTRQCRRRWYTYLNANFKKDGWTPDEDMLLSEAQKVFGNKWTEIAKVVSGRTDNAVKNRFSTLRKKREKNEAVAKERIIPCIDSNTKRNICHQGYNTVTTSEFAVPAKKMRRAHIPDDAKMMNFGNRSHLQNAISINQQPRAPFAELSQKSNNVNNVPERHHVFNDKFNGSGQNYKYELKRDDPKISALIQIIDLGNMERVWKPLLEYLSKTDIIGEKIAVLQLVGNMVKELKSSNERGHSRLRKMEPDKDSPGSSVYRTGFTLLPKSTGTGDNLESSSNQDIGTEMKATHKSTLTGDNLESSSNQDIGTDMKATHKSTGTGDNLESSSIQDIGTEMKATQFGVKNEVCEGVKEVLSTGEVAQDMIPYSEEQINASSRMEGSPLQVTPIFRSLGEGIPTPEFTDSEKNFLRKTLGVESPSHSPYKLAPCIRALRDDPRFI